MANPHKAEVKFTLGERVYTLRYDMNALAELEESFRQPIPKFLIAIKDGMGVGMLRDLLFHGLQSKHADEFTDPRAVGELMNMEDIAGYGQAIGRALSLSLTGKEPEAEKLEADPLPKAQSIQESPGIGAAS